MASLARVPGPPSPFEGRSGRVIAIVVLGIGLAIAKPWNPPSTTVPSGSAGPSASHRVAASTGPDSVIRTYDGASFGPEPPAPAWEIWAADRVTRVRFVGPPDGFVSSTAPPSEPAGTAVEGGPVIDLGPADAITALGINRPADVDLAAIRLWRFRDGHEPERIPLHERPPPWPSSTFRVFVLRDARLAANTVLGWQPGLYRLDLLIDPVDRIRSLLLIVRDGAEPRPDRPPSVVESEVDPEALARLPDAVRFWTYGRSLSGWAERAPAGECGVREIWRAVDIADRCRPIWVGNPRALGVSLARGTEVRSIRLVELDPLPGPVAVLQRIGPVGRPGLAYVLPDGETFADGIYRLDVETMTSDLHWYLEVGAGSVPWNR
ncbi:MAG TPA: hypothetical protein VFO78_01135 [Candidatus Limnocylindrales bacterium]|nr:hypothetical protein [Candidatus Limnocylindrales bacterium]